MLGPVSLAENRNWTVWNFNWTVPEIITELCESHNTNCENPKLNFKKL